MTNFPKVYANCLGFDLLFSYAFRSHRFLAPVSRESTASSGEECLPAAACRVEARSLMTLVVETASKFLGFFLKWFFRVIKGLFHG